MSTIEHCIGKCEHNIHSIDTPTKLSVYCVVDYYVQNKSPLTLIMSLKKHSNPAVIFLSNTDFYITKDIKSKNRVSNYCKKERLKEIINFKSYFKIIILIHSLIYHYLMLSIILIIINA